MKTRYIHHRILLPVACGMCLGMAGMATAVAQETRGANANSSRSTQASTTNQSGPEIEKVRVTRASYYLGSDVIAADDRKVGDVVDYYLNVNSAPHLAYVVIMTGGFLNMGGDTRAVPASAVSTTGDNCRINITSTQFWDVPVLPENRERFLSDSQHREQIAQLFREAKQSDNRQATASSQRSGSSGATTTRTARSDDPNRAGAMTGRASGEQGKARLISFGDLRNSEAYDMKGERLGYFMDAWVNLNDDRAPYVEITPTFEPFRTSFDRRYAVPTAKLGEEREYFGYTVNTTTDELNEAEWVSESEGVKMLKEGLIGNMVLRVTVPER